MAKYEYRIITDADTQEDPEDMLNELGDQGWELVSAIQSQRFAPVQLYLKKPMP